MIENRDINKIVVSNKVSFGKKDFKYFFGYKDAKKKRPLCIFFPKKSACRRKNQNLKKKARERYQNLTEEEKKTLVSSWT